jgi:hypothetical protein
LQELLLALLFAIHYHDSQPTFSKHVYPQQFGDDSLNPLELHLVRVPWFYGSAPKVNKTQMELTAA